MNVEFNQDQKLMQQSAREFAEKFLKPVAKKLDETQEFPVELIRKAAELGFMGVAIPEEYGGAGMDSVSYTIMMEEIARYCGSTSVILSVNNSLVCGPLLKYGTEEQKHKWLTPLAKGEKLGCYGLTEPNAGSDCAGTKTNAVDKGDHWLLNGAKIFITNGSNADTALVFANTDPGKGNKGISCFIVDMKSPGFSVKPMHGKMGIRASGLSELVFEDVVVPKENLLGELNKGFKIAMTTLDGGRIGIAAQAIGLARGAFEEALQYSKERVQFGQAISNFQAIQFMLSDMGMKIDAARILTQKAAWMKDMGQNYNQQASAAKLFASEMATWVTNRAIQIHGGYGYTNEYNVERYFRDARVCEIYEGTSEIQRLVVAANLLGR